MHNGVAFTPSLWEESRPWTAPSSSSGQGDLLYRGQSCHPTLLHLLPSCSSVRVQTSLVWFYGGLLCLGSWSLLSFHFGAKIASLPVSIHPSIHPLLPSYYLPDAIFGAGNIEMTQTWFLASRNLQCNGRGRQIKRPVVLHVDI